MDGTGELFAPLFKYLKGNQCKVIVLPDSGLQDYSTLTRFVKERLPVDDFVLIAESFSGPIAAQLAQQNIDNLKGIIFVATFLSAPNPSLLMIAKRLPIKLLNRLPGAGFFQRHLFCGKSTDSQLLVLFRKSVEQVSIEILKNRIQAMQLLKFQEFHNTLPTVYILPNSDNLVPKKKVLEFQVCFQRLVVNKLDGPHFILQAEPEKSASIILDFISDLENMA